MPQFPAIVRQQAQVWWTARALGCDNQIQRAEMRGRIITSAERQIDGSDGSIDRAVGGIDRQMEV